jgi:hypothetical protein
MTALEARFCKGFAHQFENRASIVSRKAARRSGLE